MPTLSPEQIAVVALQVGWTATEAPTAVAIAMAESGGVSDVASKPNSNGTTDHGLWQINSSHSKLLATGNWRDPVANGRMAYTLYKGRGNWKDWSVYNNGRYLPNLPRARAAVASIKSGVPSPTPPNLDWVGDGVTGAIKDVGSGIGAIVDLVKFLLNPRNWLRMVAFVVGLGLIGIALSRMVNIPTSFAGAAKQIAKAKVAK